MTGNDVVRTQILRWRALAIAGAICLALGASLTAGQQDSSLRAERVVDYTTGKTISLSAKVGPVTIQSVEFTDRGRGSSGGLTGVMRGSVPDMSTMIRGHFLAENPSADEWAVTFTVEFLDKSGKVIDKAVKRSTWEGEAKPTDLDHPILQYVVPLIAQVRIRLEAKLD